MVVSRIRRQGVETMASLNGRARKGVGEPNPKLFCKQRVSHPRAVT